MKAKRILFLMAFVVCLSAVAEQAIAQDLITSVTRRGGSTQVEPTLGGILQEGSLAMMDRTHVYKNIPDYLVGISEYVRIDNDDRSTADLLIDIVLATRADVYLFIDYRVGDDSNTDPPTFTSVMTWVAEMGFVDTGDKLDIDEGNDGSINQYFRIYKALLPAGLHTFKEQNSGGINVYGIAAIGNDPTFNPAPVVDVSPNYQKIYLGGTAAMSVTVTDEDPEEGDPGVLSWTWAKESGPGDVTFAPSSDNESAVTAQFDAKGLYEIIVQATDGTKDANDVAIVRVVDHADEVLMAHYPLDGDGLDAVGDIDMVAVGNADYTDGALGQAATLDGAGDFFIQTDPNIPLGDLLNDGYGITVSCWIKSNVYDTDNGFLIFQPPAGADDMDMRYDEAGATGDGDAVLKLGITTTTGILQVETSNQSQSTNWQHVVMTWETGEQIKGYINGAEEAYTAQSGAGDGVLSGLGALIIGRGGKDTDPNTMGWDGLIDDVRIYNYALPLEDSQYTSIRSLAAMGPLPPIVSVVPFEDPVVYRDDQQIPLEGSVEDYGQGGLTDVTILWTTVSGPEEGVEAVFADPSDPATTVSFPKSESGNIYFGTYVLRLTAIDVEANAEVYVEIEIEIVPPSCQDVIDAGLILDGDINKDCRVTLEDFAILAANWAKCNHPADPACDWPF
ncbi:MAG: LamG domain-containing protein [Sedimentisphaerales bacterium]|nr:LamG domain-containing protein [Sedimentisphaerales bacterium]